MSCRLAWLFLSASLATATEIVYVTDLTIFTELAPCAASAVSYNVMSMTYSACPQAVTDLQSCVCSKNNNLASFSTALSSSVSYSCGSTASDDQASAASVYKAYCNQASIIPFAKPSSPVSQYITDLAEWADLAPCAANALSYNIMWTYDLCPADASLLATCVCNKNQNSLLVSQGINTSAKYSCSSHTADLESAQALFSAYCGLNEGKSSFPVTAEPPGDMTYYITGLAEFSSLAPCAKSAVSCGVFSVSHAAVLYAPRTGLTMSQQTYDLCPGGPKALASCACLKDGMPGHVSSVITSEVKYSCDTTASEDVISALSVWDLYCSAAKGLATPAGVTESVEQTSATAKAGSGGSIYVPQATDSSDSDSSGSSGSNGSDSSSGSASSDVPKTNTMAIIAATVGFIRRCRNQNAGKNGTHVISIGDGGHGKSELDSTSIIPPPMGSPSPSMVKASLISRTDNVSPVSAYSRPQTAELQGQYPFAPPFPSRSELGGQQAYSPQQHNSYPKQSELQGQHAFATALSQGTAEAHGWQVYEAPGKCRPPVYEAYGQDVGPQRAELQQMGWQSGPVGAYHEMDGGYTGHVRQPV
ncbi:uncharacterized protein BCR38DRAFT_392153 [Pseudomassariella vexata]|uniref:Extracellular membrane protein CFEM domain-containing protein n=1 Tax=Pseudomassariella vexata TaxID=1141098 RepID=A0A1Y2DX97_9PEZI|nr:uncharacterized protein BCR38DRAFT_392153 [Pseudomassariella vexata]ORY63901.1 hypothetical protein BCR38DRAFT_392153 [Pseudomassariella vexata]